MAFSANWMLAIYSDLDTDVNDGTLLPDFKAFLAQWNYGDEGKDHCRDFIHQALRVLAHKCLQNLMAPKFAIDDLFQNLFVHM